MKLVRSSSRLGKKKASGSGDTASSPYSSEDAARSRRSGSKRAGTQMGHNKITTFLHHLNIVRRRNRSAFEGRRASCTQAHSETLAQKAKSLETTEKSTSVDILNDFKTEEGEVPTFSTEYLIDHLCVDEPYWWNMDKCREQVQIREKEQKVE